MTVFIMALSFFTTFLFLSLSRKLLTWDEIVDSFYPDVLVGLDRVVCVSVFAFIWETKT
jgi:hypothetical protein